ncbi:MAG: hypothetical protein KA325_09175 [Flavobacterium sp.]|nr:hypothetical protein [Flavobacterium sp.]
MPNLVSEIRIVLRITATYFSNQLKMESLNQEPSPDNELKLQKLTQTTQKNLDKLSDEIEKFKLRLPKQPRIVIITFQLKENKKTTKILTLENPKVDLKYYKIDQTTIFAHIKTGLIQGEFSAVSIEVLR